MKRKWMLAAGLACSVAAWAAIVGGVADHAFGLQADLPYAGSPVASSAAPTSASAVATGTNAFAPYQSIAIGGLPSAVAVGDFTGDTLDDIVVATRTNTSAPNPAVDNSIFLFVQRGDGTLAPAVRASSLGTSAGQVGLAIGDLTGDGVGDIVVAHEAGLVLFAGNAGAVLAGDILTAETFNGAGSALALVDLDGDARLDIVRSYCGAGAVREYRNDEAGVRVAMTHGTTWHSGTTCDAQVADFNTDGRPDIAGNTGVLLNNGIGGLAPIAPPRLDGPIAVGDLNGDGLDDVGGNPTQAPRIVTMYYQAADGRFAAPWSIASTAGAGRLLASDMDGDGGTDLLLAFSRQAYGTGVAYRRQLGDGLDAEVVYPAPFPWGEPVALAVGHLDRDGCKDIAATSQSHGLILLRGLCRTPPPLRPAPAPPPSAPPPPAPVPGLPTVSIEDASYAEGDGYAGNANHRLTFQVRLSARPAEAVSLTFATHDGTAVAGVDYHARTDVIGIQAGVDSATISIDLAGDRMVEAHETIGIRLVSAQGATIVDGEATGTILNDDGEGLPTLNIHDASIVEGAPGEQPELRFRLLLSRAQVTTTSVRIMLRDASATGGTDFYALPIGAQIGGNQTEGWARVRIYGDDVPEPDETLIAEVLPWDDYVIGDGTAVGTILNDDGTTPPPPVPALAIDDAAIDEGASGERPVMTFTVRQSAVSSSATTFGFRLDDGSAVLHGDYAGGVGTGTIPAGETTGVVAVTILGDDVHESDEQFTATLTSAQGATLGDAQAVGTIRNDDALPDGGQPWLSIEDAAIDEGGTGAEPQLVFTVRLSRPAAEPVTVDVGTHDDTARSGNDYRGRDAQLVIPAGATTVSFAVPVLGDRGLEGDEAFAVRLAAPAGAALLDPHATGTIRDDDAPRTSRPLPRESAPGKTGTASGAEPVADACAIRRWTRADVRRCTTNVSARWTTAYRRLHAFLWGSGK
jgi:hypothetical protein